MIKEFVEKWDKNKDKLEEYFSKTPQSEYENYEGIVKALFEKVINFGLETYSSKRFRTEDIVTIDDGKYDGTQIFILHRNTVAPELKDYVYTNTYYGSCPGCDTLLAIQGYDLEQKPNKNEVEGYMTIALHLLQKCNFMKED